MNWTDFNRKYYTNANESTNTNIAERRVWSLKMPIERLRLYRRRTPSIVCGKRRVLLSDLVTTHTSIFRYIKEILHIDFDLIFIWFCVCAQACSFIVFNWNPIPSFFFDIMRFLFCEFNEIFRRYCVCRVDLLFFFSLKLCEVKIVKTFNEPRLFAVFTLIDEWRVHRAMIAF